MVDMKATTMAIKVDLGCHKCTKKIKKILCGIPQIQNQVYDEKANTVTVTVVCCSPDEIKNKICHKGGDFVKGIEIIPEKPKPPPPIPEPPKPSPTPTPDPAPPIKPPERTCCRECSQGFHGGPCYQGFGSSGVTYYEAYGRPVYDAWGGGCGSRYAGRCYYIIEENPPACNIM